MDWTESLGNNWWSQEVERNA
uniref:Uncharacterized protein n=1 Tax=Tetranychus urticae TaxID=32264 RepID=T1KB52_TETUR